MEWPVGWWEGSGRAGTAVVGGSSCHVVACLLCPLVISASPSWWSSRRSLACQLNTGPQTTLKVLPGPGRPLHPPPHHSWAVIIPFLLLCSRIKGFFFIFPCDLLEFVTTIQRVPFPFSGSCFPIPNRLQSRQGRPQESFLRSGRRC